MPHIDPENLPRPEDFRHRVEAQIRFNDIDILGHLNNTVYFSFYDTGKAYYLEAVNGGKMNWQRVESVIANVDCSFINESDAAPNALQQGDGTGEKHLPHRHGGL